MSDFTLTVYVITADSSFNDDYLTFLNNLRKLGMALTFRQNFQFKNLSPFPRIKLKTNLPVPVSQSSSQHQTAWSPCEPKSTATFGLKSSYAVAAKVIADDATLVKTVAPSSAIAASSRP